jgi:ABC-2 type transport system ATP-binding protein
VLALGGRTALANPGRRLLATPTDGSARHVRALLDELDPERLDVEQFSVQAATLDDVFLKLTGHTAATPAQEPSND